MKAKIITDKCRSLTHSLLESGNPVRKPCFLSNLNRVSDREKVRNIALPKKKSDRKSSFPFNWNEGDLFTFVWWEKNRLQFCEPTITRYDSFKISKFRADLIVLLHYDMKILDWNRRDIRYLISGTIETWLIGN